MRLALVKKFVQPLAERSNLAASRQDAQRLTAAMSIFCVVAVGGCQTPVSQDVIERELRCQEEQIFALQDHLAVCRSENRRLQQTIVELENRLVRSAETAHTSPSNPTEPKAQESPLRATTDRLQLPKPPELTPLLGPPPAEDKPATQTPAKQPTAEQPTDSSLAIPPPLIPPPVGIGADQPPPIGTNAAPATNDPFGDEGTRSERTNGNGIENLPSSQPSYRDSAPDTPKATDDDRLEKLAPPDIPLPTTNIEPKQPGLTPTSWLEPIAWLSGEQYIEQASFSENLSNVSPFGPITASKDNMPRFIIRANADSWRPAAAIKARASEEKADETRTIPAESWQPSDRDRTDTSMKKPDESRIDSSGWNSRKLPQQP